MATHSAARWAEALGVDVTKVASPPPIAEDEGRWRVLKRDVLRTRATDAHYSTSATQQQMTEFLVRFCSENACDYRQGLNELVAPFVAPALSGAPEERYACFAAFVLRFAGKPMVGAAGCEDQTAPIESALFSLWRLISFHDPQLLFTLHDGACSAEMFATPWLMTALARVMSEIPDLLRFYSAVLLEERADPAFLFATSVALLRMSRENLLLASPEEIPEICCSLRAASDRVDALLKAGREILAMTPGSLQSELRGTLDLADRRAARVPDPHDPLCVTLTADELLESLTSTACQFQVIELRSEEEIAECGSGQIARSLLLDPSILDPSESAALDAWLDLLDVGPLTLCLVDSACCAPPQTHAAKEELTKQTIWRRLLLGIGDGEDDDDMSCRARALEKMLRRRGFPRVALLEAGGMYRIITKLGPSNLEPVVIGHEPGLWRPPRDDESVLLAAEARGHSTVARILRERLNGAAPSLSPTEPSASASEVPPRAITADLASARGHTTVASLLRRETTAGGSRISEADLDTLQYLAS